jgi:hypothetical protein
MWPLVDPMNARELAFASGVSYALAPSLSAGARIRGGSPIGDGEHRLAAGVVVSWRLARLATSLELQRGVIGDPFGTRGIVKTAMSF